MLRTTAERPSARAAAENSQDAETVLRWLRIAKDYENLANSLEAVPESPPPPVMQVPMQQQQPVQQQQSKSEPEDKK